MPTAIRNPDSPQSIRSTAPSGTHPKGEVTLTGSVPQNPLMAAQDAKGTQSRASADQLRIGALAHHLKNDLDNVKNFITKT